MAVVIGYTPIDGLQWADGALTSLQSGVSRFSVALINISTESKLEKNALILARGFNGDTVSLGGEVQTERV